MSLPTANIPSSLTTSYIPFLVERNDTCSQFTRYNQDYIKNPSSFYRVAFADDFTNPKYISKYGIKNMKYSWKKYYADKDDYFYTYDAKYLDSSDYDYLDLENCQTPQIVYSKESCMANTEENLNVLSKTAIYCPQTYFVYYWAPIVGPLPDYLLGYKYQCCPSKGDNANIVYPLNSNAGQILLNDLQPRKIILTKDWFLIH